MCLCVCISLHSVRSNKLRAEGAKHLAVGLQSNTSHDLFDVESCTAANADKITDEGKKIRGTASYNAIVGSRVCSSGCHEWDVKLTGDKNLIIGVAVDGVANDKNCLVGLGSPQVRAPSRRSAGRRACESGEPGRRA